MSLHRIAAAHDNVILPHIAVIGRMGSGKSTVAKMLSAFQYDRLSFAGALRDVAVRLYGETARNDRHILQTLGHGMRQLDSDIWVRPFEQAYRAAWGKRAGHQPGLRAVVDDCRYPNEHTKLTELGFVFVRVVADRDVRVRRLQANGKLQDEAQLEHETEQNADLLECAHTLTNNPAGDLESQVVGLINKVAR